MLDTDWDEDGQLRGRRGLWIATVVALALGIGTGLLLSALPAADLGTPTAGTPEEVAGTSQATPADVASMTALPPEGPPSEAPPAEAAVGGATPATPATAAHIDEGTLLAVGGFAETFVAVYLGRAGQDAEAVLDPFLAADVDLSGVTPAGVFVQRTSAMNIDELDGGYWAVTVAAEILTAVDERYEPAGLRYYTVGIAAQDGRLAATGAPSQIPAPPAGGPVSSVIGELGPPDGGPVTAAVERFLGALLAGKGELTVASGVSPIRPAPYEEVALRRIVQVGQDPDRMVVRAEVAATDAAGLTHVLHYALDAAQTDGEWGVVGVHAAPPPSEDAG